MPTRGRVPRNGSRPGPSRWRERTARLVTRAKTLHRWAEIRFPVVVHLADRMVSVNIFDTATRVAAQCFLTAVPLLFVFVAYAPPAVEQQLIRSVRSVFGLTGPADPQLQHLVQPQSDSLRQTTGLVGVLMVLISATALSRAVQRLCQRAWGIPRGGIRIAPWRWLAWLALWIAALVLQGALRDGFGVGAWLGVPITFAAQVCLWWWTQHLLLGGHVTWRPLAPGALMTAFSLTALSVTARFYLPRALDRALGEYGSLGAVFVALSWLIVVCLAATLSVTVGAVLAQEPFLAGRLGSPPAGQDPRSAPEPKHCDPGR